MSHEVFRMMFVYVVCFVIFEDSCSPFGLSWGLSRVLGGPWTRLGRTFASTGNLWGSLVVPRKCLWVLVAPRQVFLNVTRDRLCTLNEN